MLEMVVFVLGVYTLVFGQIRLPRNLALKGWRARGAGLFLMMPLPLAIMVGRVVGKGISVEKAQAFFGMVELGLVAAGIGGAVIFALLTRPK
jgi:hypothetical protein